MVVHIGRDVDIFDIPGAYIYTKTDEDVIVLLEGALDEIVVKVATNIYQKYVIISNKGKPLLYVQIQKLLYVLLHSEIIFWRKLVKYLESYGFQINPNTTHVGQTI